MERNSSRNHLGNAYGGGIYSNAILTLYGVNVTLNQAIGESRNGTGGEARGGGVYATGKLTLINSTINRNIARGGDGWGEDTIAGSGTNGSSGNSSSDSIVIDTTVSAGAEGTTLISLILNSSYDADYLGEYLAGVIHQWLVTYNSKVSKDLRVNPDNVVYKINGSEKLFNETNNSAFNAGNASGSYWPINYTKLLDSNKYVVLNLSAIITGGGDGGNATIGDDGKSIAGGNGTGGDAYGGGIYIDGDLLSVSSAVEETLRWEEADMVETLPEGLAALEAMAASAQMAIGVPHFGSLLRENKEEVAHLERWEETEPEEQALAEMHMGAASTVWAMLL